MKTIFDKVGGFAVTCIMLLAMFLLEGCCSPTQYITQTKFESIDLPEEMTRKCVVTTPPDRAKYVSSNEKEKEDTLTNYGVALVGDVAACNKQLESIRNKQIENAKLIAERNKDLKPEK